MSAAASTTHPRRRPRPRLTRKRILGLAKLAEIAQGVLFAAKDLSREQRSRVKTAVEWIEGMERWSKS